MTDEDIRALCRESWEARDYVQVGICLRALGEGLLGCAEYPLELAEASVGISLTISEARASVAYTLAQGPRLRMRLRRGLG